MSLFETTGISIVALEPKILGNQVVFPDLAEKASAYSHEIKAFGGFHSATIQLSVSQEEVEEWIESGIGRQICVYNAALDLVWEGFVDSIRANIGALAISRGPLMSIANDVTSIYSVISTALPTAVIGTKLRTAAVENTISKAKYGVAEFTLSASSATDTDAEAARDTILSDRAEPKTTQDISIGGTGSGYNSLTLNCLGYYHWLAKFVYSTGVVASAVNNVSTVLTAVLNADPNGFISSSRTRIETNTLPVPSWINDDSDGLSKIKALVALGDGVVRFLFGVYEDAIPVYNQIPSDILYRYEVKSEGENVYTLAGQEIVKPENVRPGQWLFISDYLVGSPINPAAALREDPRNMFIESVRYTAPRGLAMRGARETTLEGSLSQLGIRGLV